MWKTKRRKVMSRMKLYLMGWVLVAMFAGVMSARATDAYAKRVRQDGATFYWRLNESGGAVAANSGNRPLYPSLVLQDGATHYWRLGESGGTVATNFANPGVANGTYTDVLLGLAGSLAGHPDTAAAFNGSTTTRVGVGDIGARPTRGSIEFWMYSDVLENFRNPLSTSGATGGNTGFRFEANSSGNFTLVAGNSGAWETLTLGTIAASNWYHVVLTWDTSIPNLTGYLNGTQTVAGPTITNWVTRFSTFNNVELGRGFDTSRVWKGRLDEVAFYPTNLSAAAVSSHYITGKGVYTGGVTLGQPGALPWSPDTAVRFDGATAGPWPECCNVPVTCKDDIWYLHVDWVWDGPVEVKESARRPKRLTLPRTGEAVEWMPTAEGFAFELPPNRVSALGDVVKVEWGERVP